LNKPGISTAVSYGIPRHIGVQKKNWVLQMGDLVGRGDMLTAQLAGAVGSSGVKAQQ